MSPSAISVATTAAEKKSKEDDELLEETADEGVTDEELTEDEVRREQAKVQKYTDEYIAKIDELFKSKESEVMEI